MRPLFVLLVVLDALVLLGAIMLHDPRNTSRSVFILAFTALWLLFVEINVRRLAGKQFKAAQANGQVTYTFSDDGWHTASKNYTGDTAWGALEKAEETKQFLFLSFPNRFALALPKRCVSVDQLPQLRSLIRTKLGARARLDEARST